LGSLYSSSAHLLTALRGWEARRKRRGKGGEEGKGEGRGS